MGQPLAHQRDKQRWSGQRADESSPFEDETRCQSETAWGITKREALIDRRKHFHAQESKLRSHTRPGLPRRWEIDGVRLQFVRSQCYSRSFPSLSQTMHTREKLSEVTGRVSPLLSPYMRSIAPPG